MSDRLERRIRELVAEIRREDQADMPTLADMLETAAVAPRRSWWQWLQPLPAAAMAAASLLLVLAVGWYGLSGSPDGAAELDVEIGEWVAPSTAMLDLDDLLSGATASGSLLGEDEWALPTDILIEQADETFGQEL